MSSFLYRLGRFAAQRRRSVLAAWLVILVLACGGALFNDGTDDTFEIPGTQSQDALDYLARVFPETSGSSAQLVIVVPPGQDVTQLAATPTARRGGDQEPRPSRLGDQPLRSQPGGPDNRRWKARGCKLRCLRTIAPRSSRRNSRFRWPT